MVTSCFRKLPVVFVIFFVILNLSAAEYDPNCPETTLNFSMSPIGYEGVSEFSLEFSFPDYGTDSYAYYMNGSFNLPEELEIADPSNLKTSCGGLEISLTGKKISFSIPNYYGVQFDHNNSTCNIALDVRGSSLGIHVVAIEDYQLQIKEYNPPYNFPLIHDLTCGTESTSSIEVVTSGFSKTFKDDPVGPGQIVTLEYTIVNRDRDNAATNISFTEDLSAVISGLVAIDLPKNDICGAGSQISVDPTLNFTGGSLPPMGSCTFEIQLQIPPAANFGKYLSTSSNLTMDVGGSPVTFLPADDFLNVNAALAVELNILDSPINSGDDITLEYTIKNLSAVSGASLISMKDDLSEFLGVYPVTVSSLPSSNFCGAGSSIAAVSFDSYTYGLMVSNVSLNAGASCTFQVIVTIPEDMMPGVFTNTVEEVTGTINGTQYSGGSASDDVTVYRAPQLFVSFEKNVAAPGETLDLDYTLHFNENDINSKAIAFSHDLATLMPGVVIGELPKYGVCTSGTLEFSGGVIQYSGGELDTNTTCEFKVPVTIPEDAQWKNYDFPTSEVTASTDWYGMPVDSPANSASLLVSGLDFTLEFIDDPLFPGESGVMRYTIDNFSTTEDVSGMYFTHSLNGLNVTVDTVLPLNDVCGAGSSLTISGSNLIFQGGNLLAEGQCSFDVEFTVADSVENGMYGTVTSALVGTVQGSNISFPAASDMLAVTDEVIEFSKKFSADFTVAGSTIDVEYTITNTDTETLTDIAFTDDIDAALSGMVAVGLPQNDICGSGSQIDGTNTVSFSGGTVNAGDSCTFTVTYQIPGAVSTGTEILSTTSAIAGITGGFVATGNAASDSFTVSNVKFSKTFSVYDPYTKTATLSYSITNLNTTDSFMGIAFTDDLNSLVTGAVATGLPKNDVCGAGSQLNGTSFITFTGGELAPSGTCSFDVDIQFADDTASGDYTSATSDLMHNGLFLAPSASAGINIFPVSPVFTKVFADEIVTVGDTTSLVFRVNNLDADLPANELDFTDNFPVGLVPADPIGAFVSCTGGDLTVQANGITYTGGTAKAERICEIKIDVEAVSPGTLVNTTGDLTSSLGNSGTATDTIKVEEAEIPDEVSDETPDETVDEVEDLVDEEDDVDTGEIVDEIPDETVDETVDEMPDEVADETVDETQDETTDDVMPDNEVNDETQDEAVNDETVDETTDTASDDDSQIKSDDDEVNDETNLGSDGCGCSLI